MTHFVEQFDCKLEQATRTVGTNKRVLNEDVVVETELENERVKVVGVVVFEDEWESEVVEGDGGTVHMGK